VDRGERYNEKGENFFFNVRSRPTSFLTYECRCNETNERLQPKPEGSTCLGYTWLREGLEHLKIETKLINETSASVMGENLLMNR
jgi:hypothetical protein